MEYCFYSTTSADMLARLIRPLVASSAFKAPLTVRAMTTSMSVRDSSATGAHIAAQVQLQNAAPTGEGLAGGHCVPCTAGAPPLSQAEVDRLLTELNHLSKGLGYGAPPKPLKSGKLSTRPRTEPAWRLLHRPKAQADPTGAHYDPLTSVEAGSGVSSESFPLLSKHFYFKNYVSTLAFTNALAVLAEENGHHPQLVVEWGHVAVAWWTHAVQGVSINIPGVSDDTADCFDAV